MAKRTTDKTELPTIWELPDVVWPMMPTLMDEHDPPHPQGPRRVDLRRVLNGSICRLRTGCQWNRLPEAFEDDNPVPRHFQHWCQQGIFERLRAGLVGACDELHGVDWPWQAADTAMGKARMGGDLVGRNPTDRGKQG
jgi:putative transposase